MEKICIARRRITSRYIQKPEISKIPPDISLRKDHGKEIISIVVPVEQHGIIQPNQDHILSDIYQGVQYEVSRQENGQLVFNFHFNKIDSIKLLKASHVCVMLQIGRKSLAGLVKSGVLTCYLIGKRRRFLLSDIMAYLVKCQESVESNKRRSTALCESSEGELSSVSRSGGLTASLSNENVLKNTPKNFNAEIAGLQVCEDLKAIQ